MRFFNYHSLIIDPQASKTTSPGGGGISSGNVAITPTKRNSDKVNHPPVKRTKTVVGKQIQQQKQATLMTD